MHRLDALISCRQIKLTILMKLESSLFLRCKLIRKIIKPCDTILRKRCNVRKIFLQVVTTFKTFSLEKKKKSISKSQRINSG